jgi:hypothetical protein
MLIINLILATVSLLVQGKLFPEDSAASVSDSEIVWLSQDNPEQTMTKHAMAANGLCPAPDGPSADNGSADRPSAGNASAANASASHPSADAHSDAAGVNAPADTASPAAEPSLASLCY